ncbi:T9SS type A sorting domain-containing protein [Flavobacterium sp. HJ-32-4]|uniref:T9SS type A sorting domain-containing protein n=1 Tax=Flavobacterium sp. HJ-32-4 TaxID=1160795 RepID=UPI001F132515|nr:T9SS type A sorting domain-containing protein [Flavobacterium sp. HJ-32-4]UMY64755.1 T9SS type A sorting domain-containing protein [Flavobacterium sp. HJ-32-4]
MKKIYAFFLLAGLTVSAQSPTYSVTSIPHQMFDAATTVQYNNDDIYSGVISLPFSFQFYGVDYQNIVVSSNGYLSFNTNYANQYSEWNVNQAIPNTLFPFKNAILGVYHDLYNNTGAGNYLTGVTGVAPYRKFVIVFKNVPQFSCPNNLSYTEIVLYETTNLIDIQVHSKPLCAGWNSGKAILGVLDASGAQGTAAPGRNMGPWAAENEGWRFSTVSPSQPISYTVCNSAVTGPLFSTENLATGVLANATFFYSEIDAMSNTNPITQPNFFAEQLPLTLYALLNNGTPTVLTVNLSAIDCGTDTDNDAVDTADEDVNGDGNLANDDTDGDGIPNYMDDDDDGDLVLTNVELIALGGRTADYLDTDNDSIPDYLDIDDDGDGISSINEDYNNNGNLADDDLNTNGIPDYLDAAALGLDPLVAEAYGLTVYPNPVTNYVRFSTVRDLNVRAARIITLDGRVASASFQKVDATTYELGTSALASGTYLLLIESEGKTFARKIVK